MRLQQVGLPPIVNVAILVVLLRHGDAAMNQNNEGQVVCYEARRAELLGVRCK